MTETSLLPFYSADTTTKLVRALLLCKGKYYFLICQANMTSVLDFSGLYYDFLSFQSLNGIEKTMNLILQFFFSIL